MRENEGKKNEIDIPKNKLSLITKFSKCSSLCRQNITLCNAIPNSLKKKHFDNFSTIYRIGKLSKTRQCACLSFCNFCTNGAEIIELKKKKKIFIIET
jgi:hypothetical protein